MSGTKHIRTLEISKSHRCYKFLPKGKTTYLQVFLIFYFFLLISYLLIVFFTVDNSFNVPRHKHFTSFQFLQVIIEIIKPIIIPPGNSINNSWDNFNLQEPEKKCSDVSNTVLPTVLFPTQNCQGLTRLT